MDFESETFLVMDEGVRVAHTLKAEGFDASEDGTGRGIPLVPVAFQTRGSNIDLGQHVTGTIGTNSDRVSGSAPCIAFNLRGREGGAQAEFSDVASLRSASGGSSRSYAATEFAVRRLTVVECNRLQGFPDTYTYIDYGRPRKIEADEAAYLTHHGIKCWQDGEQWMTQVAADGNCYRALGNSFAVPVVQWIFQRIEECDGV